MFNIQAKTAADLTKISHRLSSNLPSNYLFAGLLAFALLWFALVLEFVVLVVVFVAPLFALVVVVVVVVVVDTFVLFAVVLARLVLVLVAVFVAVPPQANPRAPRAKTDESAIAFFIFIFKSPVFFKE